MIYTSYYDSPIGKLLLASENNHLIGLWIENQKYYPINIKEKTKINNNDETIIKTKKWLDKYFKGKKIDINSLNLNPKGTSFRCQVWNLLKEIPYGETITYGDIAKNIAKIRNKEKMSSQAIGGAVGHNPISIIIPCHRVVGTNGKLTGYSGGIDKKIKLLQMEGIDTNKLHI